ncbi:MAG: nicotinate-nucleotide--dimethylbenzimidazole phosphoribosyltransferase [Ruminococcus sp.]|nr:nicotinate-nucleotide--dimethylbenzimidazole phosphoribosyltransferase [Ruminococcus sp.]
MERIKMIEKADKSAYIAAKQHWDSIAKPLGSFGLLEEAIQKIAAVQGTENVDISRRTAVIMCGDHGVTAEGVTQCGSEVTAECAIAISDGRSNINAVASQFNIDVIAVDVGIAADVSETAVIPRKIAFGTTNMTKGAAMTREQMEQAIKVGMDMVGELKKSGTNLVITGEMGIGNTTSASAVAAVLLGLPAEQVTGRGAGLSSEGLVRKINAVKTAIVVNSPKSDDPYDVLQKLGGFETAAMVGLFLGGAYYHVPVVIDGVISASAAALAYSIEPICGEYMLASHCSGEPAGEGLLRFCAQEPIISAGLRLGEGTGGALLVPLLDGALALYRKAHRFAETSIERYTELT